MILEDREGCFSHAEKAKISGGGDPRVPKTQHHPFQPLPALKAAEKGKSRARGKSQSPESMQVVLKPKKYSVKLNLLTLLI